MQLIPYMNFSGQCREAFDHYAAALGGQVVMRMTFGESPMRDEVPPESHDGIMHSTIAGPGGFLLMGADGPAVDVPDGGGTIINVQLDDVDQAERIYAALAEGGTRTMPIQETFWALRWGMLVDRYGKPWMVNCNRPEAG